MDKNLIESIKGKSREERIDFFNSNKDEILSLSADDLANVSGGERVNPNSSGIWNGNYYTSLGYVCETDRSSIHC